MFPPPEITWARLRSLRWGATVTIAVIAASFWPSPACSANSENRSESARARSSFRGHLGSHFECDLGPYSVQKWTLQFVSQVPISRGRWTNFRYQFWVHFSAPKLEPKFDIQVIRIRRSRFSVPILGTESGLKIGTENCACGCNFGSQIEAGIRFLGRPLGLAISAAGARGLRGRPAAFT